MVEGGKVVEVDPVVLDPLPAPPPVLDPAVVVLWAVVVEPTCVVVVPTDVVVEKLG